MVCGYAFILLIDRVIIDSHSSHIGHQNLAKGNSNDEVIEESPEAANDADRTELDSPEADVKAALDIIKIRKKSTSVASQRPTLDDDMRNARESKGDRHIHNEDCHKKRKSKRQIQKEMLEVSLQQHFKKTDKFSGAMKNLIDEHKREVKRIRIQKNDTLFKSYTPGTNREGPNIFLVNSPESAERRRYAAINSPVSSTSSKEILICDSRSEEKSEHSENMDIIDLQV